MKKFLLVSFLSLSSANIFANDLDLVNESIVSPEKGLDWVCYSTDNHGHEYSGWGTNKSNARFHALDECRAYSPKPRTCYVYQCVDLD